MSEHLNKEDAFRYRLSSKHLKILVVACVLSVLAEFFVKRKTYFPEMPLDALHGFFAVIGFVGVLICVTLALILRCFLSRKESYYHD